MRRENGIQTAVRSFHTNLPVEALRCDVLPDQVAVWRYSIKSKKQPKKLIKLSDEAAFQLVERKKIDPKRLKLEIFTGPAKAFQSKENGGGGKQAAKTFGMGFGKMVGVLPKATLVDFPLALTEGLHQMPRLYGDTVRNHGKVRDWKSGGVVAGKNFGYGFMDGLSGTIIKPYKGAKENGWAGFGTGLAKGLGGLVAGPGSGMILGGGKRGLGE
ncbi:putative Vacuolar protein sorting-associated protein 13C [Glarea lozoyensis 74030]|uniref:Putative Vacuolar protein sorting-associated protein 13C n=1 Tax=Glarea lozoyensis (strain ATCC 74030 / MF5533) TaxID=1104152 RepID=H0ELV5_GLAL7|nr:putative Vacuolar protein sorting-associated protein 13C [Glarea lozoyensis 74030]